MTTSLMEDRVPSPMMKKFLLIINCLMLCIGNTVGPLIMRLYFIRGGSRMWFSSWMETAGFPVILVPLLIAYLRRRRLSGEGPAARPFLMGRRLLLMTSAIGVLTGFDDYLYAYGIGNLPVSTSALIIAAQLAFTAVFAFFLVKQRFTPYSINAIVLLTVGAGVLALYTGGDRPEGESTRQYAIGFLMTVGAALMYGFILPLVEWTYKKSRQTMSYTLVLEVQFVMCFVATAVCTIGMIINKDFQAIPREAKNFELGEASYYVLVTWTPLIWQLFYLGVVGVIYSGSSLLSGIIIAVLVPISETLAVVVFHERFRPEKAVALLLCLWGFASYFYGEMRHGKDNNQDSDLQLAATSFSSHIP